VLVAAVVAAEACGEEFGFCCSKAASRFCMNALNETAGSTAGAAADVAAGIAVAALELACDATSSPSPSLPRIL